MMSILHVFSLSLNKYKFTGENKFKSRPLHFFFMFIGNYILLIKNQYNHRKMLDTYVNVIKMFNQQMWDKIRFVTDMHHTIIQ